MNADSAATATFGIEMKETGFDAIVVSGRAEKPVYVIVEDGKAKIKDARKFWGKDAYQTEDGIKEAEGAGFEVVTIGQAGERLAAMPTSRPIKSLFWDAAAWVR